MNTQPIGIFDSGVGGTSIWTAIHALMPHENTLYLADSAHAPYGTKSKEAIIALSKKNTEYLMGQGCKIIVVACNTATTNAITVLRETYNIPFIGIEPAIKTAALQTKTQTIGILATKGTLSSELFSKTSGAFTGSIKIIEQVGEGIVELIEDGKLFSKEMKALLKLYLNPMITANIDYLVLGCTHYPYLMPLLLELLPKHVKIIDSGEAVARQTKAVLVKHDLLNLQTKKAQNRFFTNGNTRVIATLLGEKYKVDYLNF
ncbi:glutamate racemase [Mariniflexile maritimum]|uniref:glutamate racemase n=1 Tax=Mariniflexile maritimum TaxID=2682493 RepID=UPI0012F7039F|nr:glutamate racemase [Mariniflexile maritimum]